MRWNTTLSRVAKRFASQCNYAHNPNRNNDCGGGGCGENIAAGAQDVHHSLWAEEQKDWTCTTGDYEKGCKPGAVCGHYTQMIWKETQEFGCARVRCKKNSPFGAAIPQWWYMVCNYAMPGNWGNTPAVRTCSNDECPSPPPTRVPTTRPQIPGPLAPRLPAPVASPSKPKQEGYVACMSHVSGGKLSGWRQWFGKAIYNALTKKGGYSPQECKESCAQAGYPVYGLQSVFFHICLCYPSIPEATIVDSSRCAGFCSDGKPCFAGSLTCTAIYQ